MATCKDCIQYDVCYKKLDHNEDREGEVITIKYYLFCIRWLWKNRNWSDTRQKYKAMNKAWNKRSKRNG